MEKLKDPAMSLSLANSVALVGSTIYFYRQLEVMRADMVKVTQTLNGLVRKIAEIDKIDQQKSEALHLLNDQVKSIGDSLDNLGSSEAVETVEMDLTELYNALNENNIVVERPSYFQRSRRSGDRRFNSRRDTDFEDRRDTSRKASLRSQPSRDTETKVRTPTSGRSTPKREPVVDSPSLYEEDTDLIGEVRRQTRT